ncbi:MAG TPA: PrsW family intramembrane metalloprotease [Acidobacteriota bacterium]|nr:PrsW family intramembrane metalloprotease [Acidobacteriota bacterium]HQG91729.1 PrsW family intramembrane metalloprotease [Acidobacteriota bacterium]
MKFTESRCGLWAYRLECLPDSTMNPLWIVSLSAIGALVPMTVYTLIVWWLDCHEREPLRLVALSLLYGAVPAAGISLAVSALVEHLLVPTVLPDLFDLLAVTLFVPVIEETAKALPLYRLRRHTNFNNATDGIVYGSAIGFGFGMTENMIYFVGSFLAGGYQHWVWTMLLRTVFSATVHAFTTGLAGYFIGRIKFSRTAAGPMLGLGLAVAVLGHVSWNTMITLVAGARSMSQFQVLLVIFPAVFLGLFILMQHSLHEEARIIRQELAEEATIGVLSPPLLRQIIAAHRPWGRGRRHASITRELLTISTRLAFKKREQRCRQETFGIGALEHEIDGLRDGLRRLCLNGDNF